MTIDFKAAYIEAVRDRYHSSRKSEKSAILNEICNILGLSHKHEEKLQNVVDLTD